ncbi:MAG: NTP transferase domain-containing protein [Acidimicrobiales bacterium]
MPDSPSRSLAGVVLAAGAGTRLRPLSLTRPKVLCEVGGTALLDRVLADVVSLAGEVAVNAHHHADQIVAHVRDRWPDVHVEVEHPEAFGTAGAIGNLRKWLGGRDVLIANGDTYRTGGLAHLLNGWSGESPRLLVVRDDDRGDFGPWRFAGASLLPAADARALRATRAGLYEVCWKAAEQAGRLEFVEHAGTFIDCGTPADLDRANRLAEAEVR